MRKRMLIVLVLGLCAVGFARTPTVHVANPQVKAAGAQMQKNATPHSPRFSVDCVFTFTTGADNTFLKFCVTANGNITLFESPEGQEHIAVGKDGEGYGICDARSEIAYDDYAEFGDSGNWGPPSVLSQTATSVTIARTTSDGVWTLTQAFTQVSGRSPSARVAMTLQNNTTVHRNATLLRYANVDADSVFQNTLDATLQSAFGWNSVGITNPFGLVLQNVGNPPAVILTGLVQDVPDGPSPCGPFDHGIVGPVTGIDGSIVMLYGVTFGPKASKTVTVRYRGF